MMVLLTPIFRRKNSMESIDFLIKPRLYLINKKLWIFSDEIQDMTLSAIKDGVDSCEDVMNDVEPWLSWWGDISKLKIKKESCVLEYHGEFVAEFPTVEIYEMLKAYRDALIEYEASQQKSM